VCAGGYFAAGFISTLAHGDVWEKIDAPHKYPFVVRDAGAGDQLGHLYAFFERLPFWRMTPRPDLGPAGVLCFAETGRVYVAYVPGGQAVLLPSEAAGLETRWFDPRTGRYSAAAASGAGLFQPPDKEDWVWLAERRP